MLIKVRRDTLIILILAFMLIVSGRVMTYMAYASTSTSENGVPVAGVIVKGNDIVPTASIQSNIALSGFRSGSYIKGDTLITSKREVPLNEAINNARLYTLETTIPGTSITPIAAADVKVDKADGTVTVNVIEDFAHINTTNSK